MGNFWFDCVFSMVDRLRVCVDALRELRLEGWWVCIIRY